MQALNSTVSPRNIALPPVCCGKEKYTESFGLLIDHPSTVQTCQSQTCYSPQGIIFTWERIRQQ